MASSFVRASGSEWLSHTLREGEHGVLVSGLRVIDRRRSCPLHAIFFEVNLDVILTMRGDLCEEAVYVNELLFSHWMDVEKDWSGLILARQLLTQDV